MTIIFMHKPIFPIMKMKKKRRPPIVPLFFYQVLFVKRKNKIIDENSILCKLMTILYTYS
jgi:hypothetical protein